MIGGKELPLFDMLLMEEELNAWEKEGRDIWGWVATSERLAIMHAAGDGGEGRSGRTSGEVRLVNEAVVVKGERVWRLPGIDNSRLL